MGARNSPGTDASTKEAPPENGPVRQHSTRPRARHRRRGCAADRARVQHRERQHADLQAPRRGLPQRAAGGVRQRQARIGRQRGLRGDHAGQRDARRRQRRRRGHRVLEDGRERPRVPGARPGRPRPHRHPRVGDGQQVMGLFGSLDISASGLSAERLRMDVTAENLANAQSPRTAGGGPYRRKEVVVQASGDGGFAGALAAARGGATGSAAGAGGAGPGGGGGAAASAGGSAPGGVSVTGIVEDRTPNRLVYDPSHPDANAQGYVSMPNVNPVTEMVDLISASRSYEANVTAMQTTKTMFTKTLELLR